MTITDEMVERAPKALQKRISFVPWESADECARGEYRKDARAALEAVLTGKEE